MFGLRYLKASPTTYVFHFRKGVIVHEGLGLSFWYFAPNSTVSLVPISSVDVPFMFQETTLDFQNVTIQGQLTYRIADPKQVVTLLDFSTAWGGRYVSNDPEKLSDRLVAIAQVFISNETHRLRLRDALISHEQFCKAVLDGLRASENVKMLGLEILGLSILAISPTPEVAKALEAEAREEIQRQSDDAIYARRNAAVEHERRIKESELNTEIAVEEKKRQKREIQMAAEIAVEQQRTTLLEQRLQNEKAQADTQAYGIAAMLNPVRDMDYRLLMALNASRLDSSQSIAMAFRELAENAQNIGTLNITPDLLTALTEPKQKQPRQQ
jgi:regulator of protease activity HflC (stomatin/prohibitin superfamily)